MAGDIGKRKIGSQVEALPRSDWTSLGSICIFSDRQVNAFIENNTHHTSRATIRESGLSKIAQIKVSQSKTKPPAIEDSRFARGEKAKEILAPKARSKLSCEGTCEYIASLPTDTLHPF
ncbi:hypothetical protein CHIBA101_0718 [Actinomyces sp. Chiba101]|nr:hypothetical protein CHIBA101_0718 [Actinomyces sp. Chiba101]GAV94457.1 hypothetical protein ADENT20671_1226 [Actinomyces denticolens]